MDNLNPTDPPVVDVITALGLPILCEYDFPHLRSIYYAREAEVGHFDQIGIQNDLLTIGNVTYDGLYLKNTIVIDIVLDKISERNGMILRYWKVIRVDGLSLPGSSS